MLITIGILALPIIGFASGRIIQNFSYGDFIGNIQTLTKGNVLIYKMVDGDNTCYIATHDLGQYGATDSISCVKTK